jgi:hypothetical protein
MLTSIWLETPQPVVQLACHSEAHINNMSNELPTSDDSTIQWETKTSKNGAAFRVGRKIVVDGGQEEKIKAAVVARKEDFGISVIWPVEGKWVTTPLDFVNSTGIGRYKLLYYDGTIYDYRLEFSTSQTYNYHFHDETGDSYKCNVYEPGYHYVDYNSKKPTIIYITGE